MNVEDKRARAEIPLPEAFDASERGSRIASPLASDGDLRRHFRQTANLRLNQRNRDEFHQVLKKASWSNYTHPYG
jgi:hypothetical protein